MSLDLGRSRLAPKTGGEGSRGGRYLLSPTQSRTLGKVFKLAVAGGVSAGLLLRIVNQPSLIADWWLVYWIAAIAAVELMPVPAWRGLRFSISFPLILAVAILYLPAAAGFVLFVGLFDSRELKREMPLINSWFNRAEFALMAIVASAVFHSVGSIDQDTWWEFLIAGLSAATASYAVNVSLITVVVALESDLSLREVFSQLRVGAVPEFLLNYIGLGVVGLTIALFFHQLGAWAVLVLGAPLVYAREMFFKSMALEEASDQLRDRLRVTRALSNRMAEERQDERTQIAGYLHDDLAQSLFQLTLRLEMAKKRLANGDMEAVAKDLDDIGAIKERTSVMVRSLVRDLHRNPIGRKGLGEALQSFGDEVTRDTPVEVAVDVIEITLPPPIQLLIYQIGREAVMNAMKYAEPTTILISLKETENGRRAPGPRRRQGIRHQPASAGGPLRERHDEGAGPRRGRHLQPREPDRQGDRGHRRVPARVDRRADGAGTRASASGRGRRSPGQLPRYAGSGGWRGG